MRRIHGGILPSERLVAIDLASGFGSDPETQPLTMTMTMGVKSTVLLLSSAAVPTSDNAAYVAVGWLTALAPDSSAQPLTLACLADAALYAVLGATPDHAGTTAGIAPGESVSLFVQGLGPQEGVQPSVTLESGYPGELSGVQVLFDGQPAPLIYVQDGQINAVVLWALSGVA